MKKLVTAVVVMAFALSAGVVMAAKVKCTVDSVEGNKVTMTCTDASSLKAGAAVEVKAGGKKAIEGC